MISNLIMVNKKSQIMESIMNNKNILMNTVRVISLCTSVFFISTYSLSAQVDKDLPSGKVEVISSYEAKLVEAEKLTLSGELGSDSSTEKNYQYQISTLNRDKKPPVKYEAPEIRPLGLPSEKLPIPYNGYAKLGVSYPLGLYGEGGYTVTNSDSYFLDISGKHQSVLNSPRVDQKFSENGLKGTGTAYLKNGLAINGLAAIDLNNYRFYGGYEEIDTSFASEFSKRNFRNLQAGVKLFNGHKNKMDLDYWVGGNIYNYADNFQTRENNLALDLGVTKWISGKHSATLQITNSLLNYKDTVSNSLNNLNLKPAFTFHGDAFKFKAGANLVSSAEGFNFFPDIEATINIAGPALLLFAGAGGDMYQQSFKRITTENPFITLHYQDPFNTKYYDFYGGVAGGLRNVSYRLKAGYKPTKNYPIYIQQKEDLRQFNVYTDDVNIFYFGGELSTKVLDKLQLNLNALGQIAEARFYSKVFGLVPFSMGLNATYLALDDKLRLKGDLNFSAGSYYRNRFDSEGQLKPLFDVSVGADYFFTPKFGAFANLNNLAAVKYQRWYKYPTYGINVVGGIVLRF